MTVRRVFTALLRTVIEEAIRQYGPREALIRTIRRGKKTDWLNMRAEHERFRLCLRADRNRLCTGDARGCSRSGADYSRGIWNRTSSKL